MRGVLDVSQQLKLELLERLGGAMPIKSAPIDLQTSPQPLKTSPSSRVSIVMNWRRITKVFREVYHQAQQKYASRMFLHWYLDRTQELSAFFCMSCCMTRFAYIRYIFVIICSCLVFELCPCLCFIPPHPSHLPDRCYCQH